MASNEKNKNEKNKEIVLTLIKKKIKLDLILVDLEEKTLSPEVEIRFY